MHYGLFLSAENGYLQKHLVNILTVCYVDPKLYVDPIYGKELRSM